MTMIMTSWQRLWCHDNNDLLIYTIYANDNDYDVMTMIMMSWQWLWHHDDNDYDIMTIMIIMLWEQSLWCHNDNYCTMFVL